MWHRGVTRSPPCAGARRAARHCRRHRRLSQLRGASPPGRPRPRWHPLPFGDTRGGDDVTMKQPGPACHAVDDRDRATARRLPSSTKPPARLRRGRSLHGLQRGGHRYVTPPPHTQEGWGGPPPKLGVHPGLSVTGGMLAAPMSPRGQGPSLQDHPRGPHCPPHAPACPSPHPRKSHPTAGMSLGHHSQGCCSPCHGHGVLPPGWDGKPWGDTSGVTPVGCRSRGQGGSAPNRETS